MLRPWSCEKEAVKNKATQCRHLGIHALPCLRYESQTGKPMPMCPVLKSAELEIELPDERQSTGLFNPELQFKAAS